MRHLFSLNFDAWPVTPYKTSKSAIIISSNSVVSWSFGLSISSWIACFIFCCIRFKKSSGFITDRAMRSRFACWIASGYLRGFLTRVFLESLLHVKPSLWLLKLQRVKSDFSRDSVHCTSFKGFPIETALHTAPTFSYNCIWWQVGRFQHVTQRVHFIWCTFQ